MYISTSNHKLLEKKFLYNFTSCALFQNSMCISIANMFPCLIINASCIIERWSANLWNIAENVENKALIFINTCTLTRKYVKILNYASPGSPVQCFYLPMQLSFTIGYHLPAAGNSYSQTRMFHVWGFHFSGSGHSQLPW